MSLDVQIKVDTGGAERSADKVEKSLADTEKQAEMATRAMNNLSRSLASLNQVMQARANATQIHARLNNTLANSFAAVAGAIEREKRMLVSIRGDMDAYQRDVQVLDSLMKRGAITATEYAAALARSRAAAGMGNPMDAVSLTMPKTAAPTKPQDFGTTMMRGAMATTAIGAGIAGAASLSDEYTNLSNRLRQVTSSQDELNKMLERVGEVANRTRSDVGATGESFVRMAKAGREMGLSNERALAITETLNMAIQSSGATASEAAAGTLQLMQAMRSGTLQGDEFRSVSENMSDVMDMLAKQMGVSTGELKKLGSEGKITSAQMVKAIEASAASVKKNFEASDMTFSQSMTIAKNYAKEIMGSGVAINKLYDERFGLLQKIRVAEMEELSAMNASSRGMTEQIERLEGMSAAYNEVALAQVRHMDNTAKLVDALVKNRRAVDETLAAYKKIRMEATMKSAAAAYGLQDREAANAILADYKQVADEAKKWHEEVERIAKLEPRLRNVGNSALDWSKIQTTASSIELSAQPDPTARLNALGGVERSGFFNNESEAARLNALADQLAAAADNMTALDRAAQSFGESMRQGVVDQVEKLGDTMADVFMTGEFSFKKMVDAWMRDLTRLAIRQTVMFGFQAAFPSLFSPAKPPGFAHGGSFMVGGAGGTDTTPVAFMATPGERVTVETEEQQHESGGGGGGGGATSVVLALDERALLRALNSPMGATVIDNVLRKNPGLLRR